MRNPESKQTVQAQRLAEQARHLYLLSGSPIVNRPNDLAPLISMLTRKNITPGEFDQQFLGTKTVSPGILGRLRGVPSVDIPAPKNTGKLKSMLAGHVDYHAPASPDVTKNEERIAVPMSPQQERLHQGFWGQLPWLLRWKLKKDYPLTNEEMKNLSSFLSGPRQVGLSTLPFMKGKADPYKAYQQSPKLQMAHQKLQEMLKDQQSKAVVFSNFIRAGLDPYAAALQKDNVPYGMFHGGLGDVQRKQVVDDYNTGKSRVMLLGPAGGEGISLKGTRLMQLLDPHWNETRNHQAIGRGIRFDSHSDLPEDQRNVKVQRFVSQLPEGRLHRLLTSLWQRKPDTERSRPGVDTYLERLAGRKEKLNDEFRAILQEVGTPQAA